MADSFTNATIATRRLHNHVLTRAGLQRPADVVEWLGAVQAQEYEPAKWALGLRMQDGVGDGDVERAFNAGRILRTHVMRPTWHFVTPRDIRWMLELTAPRVHRVLSSYTRRNGLDSRALVRGTSVIERAFRDRHHLTRSELGERLQGAGLRLRGLALALLTVHAELEGVICSGPRRGKQFTYALIAERAPRALRLSRDEALATLTRRYFSSHGPATIRDFVWWSGLITADAKRGLEIIRARREEVGNQTFWTVGPTSRGSARDRHAHLLPIYDEYLVAYRDREAVPHGPSLVTAASRPPVTFQHAIVVAGHVAGTWRMTRTPHAVLIDAVPLRPLTRPERRAVSEAATRYEQFVSVPVQLTIE